MNKKYSTKKDINDLCYEILNSAIETGFACRRNYYCRA